jgi:hypothetical protein
MTVQVACRPCRSAGALIGIEERLCAGQIGFAVHDANDTFGPFEPFRWILVGRLRKTAIRPLGRPAAGLKAPCGELPCGAEFSAVKGGRCPQTAPVSPHTVASAIRL